MASASDFGFFQIFQREGASPNFSTSFVSSDDDASRRDFRIRQLKARRDSTLGEQALAIADSQRERPCNYGPASSLTEGSRFC